jgi:hypothetical protein
MAPLAMFDSIDLGAIPEDADAVAGYVDGRWPTFHLLASRWPRAHRLSIAVSAHSNADALDIETGDASVDEAASWVRRQHERGLSRPVLYMSISAATGVLEQLHSSGLSRSSFRLWTAHYTGRPHRCSHRCWASFHDLAGATQWTDRSHGRNLDESSVYSAAWFPRVGG